MKKKNREINIFSMSALDLFASAMGAFILITVVALPYYLKTDSSLMQEAAELREQINQLESQNEQLQQELEESLEQLKNCEEQLEVTFLAVVVNWETRHDVDLHVIDPQGHEYFYKKRTHPGSNAILSKDAKDGPGIEVWEYSNAKPGKYKIMYKLFAVKSGGGNSVKVKGSLYYRGGSKQFPAKTINKSMGKIHVATITIAPNGRVHVDM